MDRPIVRPESRTAYLVAVLAVAVATVLRLQLAAAAASMPYLVFFPMTIAVTFACGSAAGLLATVLSVLSAWLFVIPRDLADASLYRSVLFVIGTVTAVAIIGGMRAATAHVRRLNETLRVREEMFRGLLESAPDAIVIVDERNRIVLINAQAEMLFGYRRADLVEQPVEMLIPERSRAKYLTRIGGFRTDAPVAPTDRAIELHGTRRDGTEFPIEISLGTLRTEAGFLVSSAIRDITARRRIEASFAEASKAKSDFLAGVSHELRTPLNAIIGFSEMIRDAIMGPLDARYQEYAGDIAESGRHLQNIINDILDISKVEGGRLELRDEAVSIGETVGACRRIVAPMAEAAGVSLSIDVPTSLPLIRSDEVRFKQILLNLMSNAVKFTPDGGRVSVYAQTDAEGAVIAVEDTGIGMKPEDIEIALEPFRQIDGALSRRFDGTGLGLPLAKALVELHGGHLDIQSALAEGTVVRVRLPRERVIDAAA